jgi:hypothetical protein
LPVHDHAIYFANATDVIVTRNIFYNIRYGWGVLIAGYDYQNDVGTNWEIYNNTFSFTNQDYSGGICIVGCIATNINIKNNIFYDNFYAGVRSYSAQVGGLTMTNNIVQNGIMYSKEQDVTELDAPVSTNNIVSTDPLLVNPASYDFRLQSGSPAINAGVNVGLTTDFYRNSIIGLPDRGAIEYAGVLIQSAGNPVRKNTKLIRKRQ